MTAVTAPQDKLYLVWPADEDLPCDSSRLISAPDEDGAVARYIEHVLAQQDDWLEEVYTNSEGGLLAGRFYTEKGVPLWDEQGDWVCTPDEARSIFERNVRDFFGVREDWAELYLKFYFENHAAPWRAAMAEWQFPQEMVGYMLRTMGGGWCDIARLALEDIPRIA